MMMTSRHLDKVPGVCVILLCFQHNFVIWCHRESAVKIYMDYTAQHFYHL